MISIEKDDWYRDRILWRANQHNLLDKKCCEFSDLPEEDALKVREKLSEDIIPVIAFWGDLDKWTVLGTRAVCSFFDGKLSVSSLDEINHQVSVYRPFDVSPADAKTKSNFILLEESGQLVWATGSSELFALMNILLMFPLRKYIV